MTAAILLVACLVLLGAVVALAVAVRRVERRLAALEQRTLDEEVAQRPSRNHGDLSASAGFETGASAPSSTSEPSRNQPEHTGYLITRLGDPDPLPAPALEGRLFADIVLRESVVKAASWAYAVRRGLSPENRNRIRFEMRREVKRARKHRKAEEREAIREWRARKRAAGRPDAQESAA